MTIQKNFLFTVRGNTKTKLLTPSRAKFSFDKKLQFCKIQWIDPLLHHKISALLATGKLFLFAWGSQTFVLAVLNKKYGKYNIYRYIWFPGMRFTEHWVVNNFCVFRPAFGRRKLVKTVTRQICNLFQEPVDPFGFYERRRKTRHKKCIRLGNFNYEINCFLLI